MCIMANGIGPPAYHPENFLMKNIKSSNHDLIFCKNTSKLHATRVLEV